MSERTTKGTAKEHKRIHTRFEVKSQIKYRVISDTNREASGILQGRMLNLSQGGMLVLTQAQLQPLDFLAIDMEIPPATELNGVIGKVKRIERVKDDYVVGIEFCELAEFYSSGSMVDSNHVPKNLDTFLNKLKEILLRRKVTKVV